MCCPLAHAAESCLATILEVFPFVPLFALWELMLRVCVVRLQEFWSWTAAGRLSAFGRLPAK